MLFSAAAGVRAQGVSGTVTDANGAVIPGARLTVNDDGKVIERTSTNAEGEFTLSEASRGKALAVRATAFAERTLTVPVDAAEPLRIVLDVSSVETNVTVTVTRTEEDSLNASIAVITIDSLGVTAARTADDTLRQIPGFQLFRRSGSRTTNPTAQGANLRGVSGSGASRTTVLFDGLSLNDAFGGWTYWSRVPMIAVEQIEVFRGGASSFYGSGGLSGAINIVPVKRSGEKFLLKAETSAASQNTGDLSALLLASRGLWHVDLIGDVFRTGGYIPVEEASRGSVDTPAASRHGSLILKIGRSFGETGRVFARGNLFRERRDNGTRLTDNQTNFRQLAFGADAASQRYGEMQFRAFGERQVYDQTFSAVATDRESETLTRLQRVPSNAVGASIFWRKRLSDHSFAASAEMLRTRGFSDEVGYIAGDPANVSRSGGEARDLSFFIQDNWKALPKFSLNLSARIDARQNSDGIATTRTIATGNVTETRFPDRSDTSFSPRIAAVFDINDAAAVYASYARSFRAPSLNELYRGFRVGNIVTEANAFLTPERANTFEAGGSYSLTNPTLILRASVYSTRVIDPVVSITTSSTPTLITRQRRNVGSTLSRGFEADMQFWPMAKLKLNAGYLFVDAKISSFPADPALVGNALPQVARHSFTAQARYDIGRRWNVSTQLRASSSQFEDDRNTLLLRKYFTADARAAHKFSDAVEALLAIENLFNSRYDIGRTPVRTIAAPRSVRLGLRINLPKR
ncbi:MAG: TonB-dependent receptor [Acidobacteriota bacterium]|nr:MAG: TonB-dependent receptor [Acidobacteriota bacterium]